jgi:hypothetical protein
MLRRVALVIIDVSEESSASIIRVTRIGKLGTLAVTNNRHNLTIVVIATFQTLACPYAQNCLLTTQLTSWVQTASSHSVFSIHLSLNCWCELHNTLVTI